MPKILVGRLLLSIKTTETVEFETSLEWGGNGDRNESRVWRLAKFVSAQAHHLYRLGDHHVRRILARAAAMTVGAWRQPWACSGTTQGEAEWRNKAQLGLGWGSDENGITVGLGLDYAYELS